MSVNLQTVILSHLNDLSFEVSAGEIEYVRNRIKFIKHLLFTYGDVSLSDTRLTNDELNEIWKKEVLKR